MNGKICRLCLQTVTNIFQTIEESTLETLKLNPKISKETVICTECASYLEVLSHLKPARVYMRDNILALTDHKNENPTYETTSDIKLRIETEIKCSFCARISGREDLVSLNDSKRFECLMNLLKQYIPEMNIKNAEELLTCETCVGTLRDLCSFVSKYLEVEEKINKYTEVKGVDETGQIELRDVQQFMCKPTKLEIESFDANGLGEKCDRIQKESAEIAGAEVKYESEMNHPKTEFIDVKLKTIIKSEEINIKSEKIVQTEDVDIKSETIINTKDVTSKLELIVKTEDIDIKSEHSDSNSFQDSFVEYKIVEDPLEKKYIKENMFKCETCSYQSKYKAHVKRHSLIHRRSSEIRMFRCELCSYEAKRKGSLQTHILTHKAPSEVSMFECGLCPYQAKRKTHLQMHILNHRSPSEVPMYKCKLCSYEAKHKMYLQKHILTHKNPSEVPMYKCELCPYQTKHKEYLPYHLLTHKTPSEIPMFKCELCPYETKRKRYLQLHILTHKTPSEVPMFKCEMCSYQTKRREYLQKHLLTHKPASEVPVFKCELCSYQTKRKEYIPKHILTHKSISEVPVFQCDLCPYRAKCKEYLRMHLLTHKGNRRVGKKRGDSSSNPTSCR